MESQPAGITELFSGRTFRRSPLRNRCDAEILFPEIEKLVKKLSDGNTLGENEDKSLRKFLDEYWNNIECPFECRPNKCLYANPQTWIEYHGYTSMAELLWYFEYEGIDTLKLRDKKSIDALDANWARRPGNYNP